MNVPTRWIAVALAGGAVALARGAPAQTIDRSKRPPVVPPPPFTFPRVESKTLPNGLVVHIVENRALPLVAVRAVVEGGSLLDPAGKEGLFTLDTLAVRDGTTSMNGEQIADAVDELGAPVLPLRFTTLSTAFERSLAIMGDMLMHPSFPADAVERRKAAVTSTLQRQEATASTPALRIFNATLWGEPHPFARTMTPASIASITRDDVARFHETYVRPQNLTITIVGDVSPAAAMAAVTKVFGGWQRTGARVAVDVSPPPAPRPTTIYLYDRPNSPQSTVFVGQTVPGRTSADFYALETMGALFGGGTGSRVNMSLRENRPLTYSVSHLPVWRRLNDPASFHGSANVDAAKTDSAIAVWLAELKGVAGARPPVEAELAFARNATVRSLVTRIETIDEVANRLNLVARDGLAPSYYDDYIRGMNRVTVAGVAATAARVVDPAHTTIVVVGDRGVVEPRLRAANIAPIVVVDQSGKPVP